MSRKILLALSIVAIACTANSATFQKVRHQEEITSADVKSCQINGNKTLDIFFAESGVKKLQKVLDEDNSRVSVLVDGVLVASVTVPSAIENPDQFRFSVNDPKEFAKHLECLDR